jgi:hypothetical protein
LKNPSIADDFFGAVPTLLLGKGINGWSNAFWADSILEQCILGLLYGFSIPTHGLSGPSNQADAI